MARIYSGKKGSHGSHRPPIKFVPRWITYKKNDVETFVLTLAKERHSSAVIGQILRDRYGIPDVKTITGKAITQIMRENKLYPEIPEDLMSLLKNAVELREHIEKHKADKLSLRGLQNLESKIRRLSKYYSREGVLPKDWRYDPSKAKLIVQK